MKTRIPIRFSKGFALFFTILLLPPGLAYIEIEGDTVRVRMAWAFRTRFSRGDITAFRPNRPVVSVGAHGWNGRWLVNGANRPIACITLARPVPARVLGFPIQLRELLVSVDDVAQLQHALLT